MRINEETLLRTTASTAVSFDNRSVIPLLARGKTPVTRAPKIRETGGPTLTNTKFSAREQASNTTICNGFNTRMNYSLSQHAWKRMCSRGISSHSVQRVIHYGRVAHVRGATIYAVGRKEVERHKRNGVDLSKVEGVHVVSSKDGKVITVYRNHDLRGLRPCKRVHRYS